MLARATSVTTLVILVCSSSAALAQVRELTSQQRSEVIQRVLNELDQGYVFPDVARAMHASVQKSQREGRYDRITDPAQFARSLSEDLRAVSHDGHLRIVFSGMSAAQPSGNRPNGPPPAAVENVSRLDGNIGYIKINGFPPPDVIGPRLTEAMKELNSTDALIIDLRDNGGGAPGGAMYLAGHFFEKPTLVAHIFSRPDSSYTEMWTERVPGPLYLHKKIYILTSRRTFSAGEAAAYHLKHIAGAITVGDTTGGGAHRIRGVDAGHGFTVTVPMTRPINVVTKSDWEGKGVIPEIAVHEKEALTAAHLAALKALPKTTERETAIRKLLK